MKSSSSSPTITEPDAGVSSPSETISFPAHVGTWRWIDRAALAVLLVVAFVLRFWTRSPMWLDEALTVHIASLPVGQISGALRHDGHPPLFYFILHWWMQVFGRSDLAVRSLPAIFGVATVPLMWVAGRRLGGRTTAWCGVVLIAVLPFALRYSTENRMYSLIMLLALVSWILATRALDRPRPVVLGALALCTSALLWTHYWAMWLGLAAAITLVVRLIRKRKAGATAEARSTMLVLGSLAVGAITFIPWVGTLLYQSAHTGTPWGARSAPTSILMQSVQDLGGGLHGDQVIAGWTVCLAILLGLFAFGTDRWHLLIDVRTQRDARAPIIVATLTMVIATTVMMATNAAFQSRYNAIWLPFALLVGALGLSRFKGEVVFRSVLAIVVLVCLPGAVRNVITPRTQAATAAMTITQNGKPGDVVGVCPDQLGPALVRELSAGFQVGSYPDFSDPHTVDWVDYVTRTQARTPKQFANDLLERAGPDHRIFLVWSGSYRTHQGLCEQVSIELQAHRPLNSAARQHIQSDLLEGSNVFEYGVQPPVAN